MDTTLMDVMWAKQSPWTQLESEEEEWHTHIQSPSQKIRNWWKCWFWQISGESRGSDDWCCERRRDKCGVCHLWYVIWSRDSNLCRPLPSLTPFHTTWFQIDVGALFWPSIHELNHVSGECCPTRHDMIRSYNSNNNNNPGLLLLDPVWYVPLKEGIP